MPSQLPKLLDPIKLGKLNTVISGQILLRNLNRLQSIADQLDQLAQVTLQFGQDESHFYFIKERIQATVHLICQRCNQPMQCEIDATMILSPVVSDERAKKLPDCYEPVSMTNESIAVIDMVEDEILLVLPMVPKHAVNQCKYE